MKPATQITIVFLLLVAALHVLRLLLDVPVRVGTVDVPSWASVLAVIIPTALAVGLWRERR